MKKSIDSFLELFLKNNGNILEFKEHYIEFNDKLEFYKKNDDGTVVNLTGEQRRETETFIASAIGTEEDFLSTILTTGYNLEELIESKPTARGQILTKFIGLENLKQKEEVCKQIYNDWSKKLVSNTYNIIQLESEIDVFNDGIKTNQDDIVKLNEDLKDTETNLKQLETRRDNVLSKRNDDIDQELIKTNPDQIKKDIGTLKTAKQKSLSDANSVDVKEPSQFYLEEDHTLLKDQINGLVVEGRVNLDAIKRNEDLLKQLQEGQICPTCNRALEDVDHTDEIEKIIEDYLSKTSSIK